MKVWLTIFFCLFAIAEFYLWVKEFIVPLPVYIIGGAFLAIASNYEKGIAGSLPWQSKPKSKMPKSLELESYLPPTGLTPVNSASTTMIPQGSRPISFTIKRKEPEHEEG